MELKQLSALGFEKAMKDLIVRLPQHFRKVQQRHPDIQGFLLLASKVDHDGYGNLLEPKLVGKFWADSTGEWQDVSPSGKRVARGQKTVVKKLALPQIWSEMEWHRLPDGAEVGLFSQFLKWLRLPHRDPQRRADAYNKILRSIGVRGRIVQGNIKNRPGKKPWVASKAVLKAVYKYLRRCSPW